MMSTLYLIWVWLDDTKHIFAWEIKRNGDFVYISPRSMRKKKELFQVHLQKTSVGEKKTQLVLPVQLYANLHVPSNVTLHDAYTV